jgi:hypothetical protein
VVVSAVAPLITPGGDNSDCSAFNPVEVLVSVHPRQSTFKGRPGEPAFPAIRATSPAHCRGEAVPVDGLLRAGAQAVRGVQARECRPDTPTGRPVRDLGDVRAVVNLRGADVGGILALGDGSAVSGAVDAEWLAVAGDLFLNDGSKSRIGLRRVGWRSRKCR